MSRKISIAVPIILALKGGEIIQALNKRLFEIDGVPASSECLSQVHAIQARKSGREYAVSHPGIVLTLEDAMACLELAVETEIHSDELKAVKKSSKDFNFAYIRTRSKDGKSTFGNLYVTSGDIQHWEWEKKATA